MDNPRPATPLTAATDAVISAVGAVLLWCIERVIMIAFLALLFKVIDWLVPEGDPDFWEKPLADATLGDFATALITPMIIAAIILMISLYDGKRKDR